MPAEPADNLHALIKRLEPVEVRHPDPDCRFICPKNEAMTDAVCDQLVWSYLVWEAGAARAEAIAAKLCESFVDLNEFRVCLPSELAGFFGLNYPRAAERAERVRATLCDIYEREHEVSLQSLQEMNKREAKAYLDSLEGIPLYVASRTFLMGLGGHAFPLDERLLALLAAENAVPEGESVQGAASWLERQFRSGEAAPAFAALEAWADEHTAKRLSKKTSARKSSSTKSKSG